MPYNSATLISGIFSCGRQNGTLKDAHASVACEHIALKGRREFADKDRRPPAKECGLSSEG